MFDKMTELADELTGLANEHKNTMEQIHREDRTAIRKMGEQKERVYKAFGDKPVYEDAKKAVMADPEYSYWAGQHQAYGMALAYLEDNDG